VGCTPFLRRRVCSSSFVIELQLLPKKDNLCFPFSWPPYAVMSSQTVGHVHGRIGPSTAESMYANAPFARRSSSALTSQEIGSHSAKLQAILKWSHNASSTKRFVHFQRIIKSRDHIRISEFLSRDSEVDMTHRTAAPQVHRTHGPY